MFNDRPQSRRLSAAVALVLLCSLLKPVAAWAACSDEIEQFFIRASTSDVVAGTDHKILLRDRALDSTCSSPVALSTAHINDQGVGTAGNSWVEIGWWEEQAAGGKAWTVFVEKGVNGSVSHVDRIVAPNLELGTYDRWRVKNNPRNSNGTTNWDLQVDFLKGGGWVDVITYTTSWHKGWAYGETEAKGHDTGMYDEQRDLKYRGESSSGWTAWPGQICRLHNGPTEYKWVKLSNSAYNIELAGGGEGCF